MTSVFTVQLNCDCTCCHLADHGCHVVFPDQAIEGTAKALRVDAGSRGWEVLRNGVKGRDVCPPCRIVEIRAAARLDPAKSGDA